jgi:hypothetical protein
MEDDADVAPTLEDLEQAMEESRAVAIERCMLFLEEVDLGEGHAASQAQLRSAVDKVVLHSPQEFGDFSGTTPHPALAQVLQSALHDVFFIGPQSRTHRQRVTPLTKLADEAQHA